VRLGGQPFFYAASAERLDLAIELALAFQCSPMEFLDLPDHVLGRLYDRTAVIVRRQS
jgi:hypothetical protein